MTFRILVFGLPGVGKTTLAAALAKRIDAVHWDGDPVRELTHNWDFTHDGRARQALTMRRLCDTVNQAWHPAVASFIAPTDPIREVFNADFSVWIDRTVASPFRDTNQIWQEPKTYSFRISPGPLPVTPAPYVDMIVDRLTDAGLWFMGGSSSKEESHEVSVDPRDYADGDYEFGPLGPDFPTPAGFRDSRAHSGAASRRS